MFMTEQETATAAQHSQPSPNPDAQAVESVEPSVHGKSLAELQPGMELSGKVKSVTDFGAFVDLGIGQDGLVHISELARRRIEKVTDVVQVGDEVQVWVKKVDKKRGRISLTMVKPATRRFKDLQPESVIDGVVTRIESYGAFVDIGTGRDGLVHVSELAEGYISSPSEVVSVGDRVEVKVLKVDRKARKVDLSMKELAPKAPQAAAPEPAKEEEPAPTVMALAFQAALKGDDSKKKQRGVDKLIATSLKR
jgi:small subunit ribosomal protein S1